MSTDKKLYAAIAVLAVLGGALFLATRKKRTTAAHTIAGQQAELPKLAHHRTSRPRASTRS